MTLLEEIGNAVGSAIIDLWVQLLSFLPELIAGLIVLIVGIIIAKFIAKLVEKIVLALKVDPLIRKINIVQKLEEAGTKVVFSEILSWLVKWFLYVILLVAVADILDLDRLANFINQIALYLPSVIIAVLILAVGLVLGDFIDKLVVNILKSTRAKLAPLIGAIAKWAIYITALIAALEQLQVAETLLQTAYTAIAATVVLSAGLAFGLGGRDAAKEMIQKVRDDIKE